MNSEANYKQVNEIVNSQTEIKVVKLITLRNTGSLKFTGFEKCGRAGHGGLSAPRPLDNQAPGAGVGVHLARVGCR
jgi:hypothetical protein